MIFFFNLLKISHISIIFAFDQDKMSHKTSNSVKTYEVYNQFDFILNCVLV